MFVANGETLAVGKRRGDGRGHHVLVAVVEVDGVEAVGIPNSRTRGQLDDSAGGVIAEGVGDALAERTAIAAYANRVAHHRARIEPRAAERRLGTQPVSQEELESVDQTFV